MDRERGFESMEHDNERSPMKSNQSEMTSQSLTEDWKGVFEMKHEAMDEAYGLAGKRGVEMDSGKEHSQFRHYNWG